MKFCPSCGTALPASGRFCRRCGRAVRSAARPTAASETAATPAQDPQRSPAPAAARPAPAPVGSALGARKPGGPRRRPGSPAEAAVRHPGYTSVALACLAVSVVGWIPLSLPSRVVNGQLGRLALWNVCTDLRAGSPSMFGCSAVVGILTVALGPLLTAYLLYLFRAQLAKAIRAGLERMGGLHEYTAPIAATAVFLVAWAGTHFETYRAVGLLPNVAFPAVVGLFAHWSALNSEAIQRRFAALFDVRDRIGLKARLLLTLGSTTAFAVVLSSVFETSGNRVAHPTAQQQIVVLVGLVVGYALMVPRTGDPLGEARRLARKLGGAR